MPLNKYLMYNVCFYINLDLYENILWFCMLGGINLD